MAGITAYIQPAIAPIIEKLHAARDILPTTDLQVAGELFQPVPWFAEITGDESTAPGGQWSVINLRPEFSLPPGMWHAFPAGLTMVIETDLRHLGYDVQTHLRPGPAHGDITPNAELLATTTGDEYQFLSQVSLFPRGLILTRRQGQVVEHTALLARLFPSARIAIAVATRREARRFRQSLANALTEPVGVLTPENQNVDRCVVVTFNVLESMAFAFSAADIVVIPEAEKALGNVMLRALAGMQTQRVYGFLPAAPSLYPQDNLTLRAFIGPTIYRTPECPRRAVVQVFTCGAPHIETGTILAPGLQRKEAIWRSAARNQLIADLAHACAVEDFSRCQELGICPAESLSWIPAPLDQPPRIAILVDSIEHANVLQRLIPESEIIQKSTTAAGTTIVHSRTARSGIDIQIVTAVAAQIADWSADVVIRGSGDICTLISRNLPRVYCAADEHDQQLLFDVTDGLASNDLAETRRQEAYYENGWDVKY